MSDNKIPSYTPFYQKMESIIQSLMSFGTILPNGMQIKSAPQRIYVYAPKKGNCLLCIRRDGQMTELKISRKVAAELISAGFGYCD